MSLENKGKDADVSQSQQEIKTIDSANTYQKVEEPPAIRSGQILSIKDIVAANPGRIIIAQSDTNTAHKINKGLKL